MPKAAKTSASIFSLMKTDKENGLNFLSCLEYLFHQLPYADHQNPETHESFRPRSEVLLASCRNLKQYYQETNEHIMENPCLE